MILLIMNFCLATLCFILFIGSLFEYSMPRIVTPISIGGVVYFGLHFWALLDS